MKYSEKSQKLKTKAIQGWVSGIQVANHGSLKRKERTGTEIL